jgi:serine/threonine-protein kinase HipA
MSGRELEVSVNGQLVGHLREAADLWAFDYAPEWSAAENAFDLSPALPRSQLMHADGASSRPVQWYFDNLLPEENLRLVLAREAKIEAEDAFGLLAWFGAESAGSLVLRAPGQPQASAIGLVPLTLETLSQRIKNLPRDSLIKDAPKRMSLAGAQHKLLVVMRDGELFEPVGDTPSTHILKPNHLSDDYRFSVVNEYFTMRLAKAAGLDVPNVHKRYVPQPVYLVDRFDRTGDEPVRRIHIIDSCQLLNKSRAFKYTAARVETLAEAVQHCRAKAAARLHLYRWLVFNVLVGNGDNHLKNLSFIVKPDGVGVAPAYDLLSTAVYSTRAIANEKATWPNVELAMTLGNAGTFGAVTRRHLLEAGHALKIARQTAERELDNMLRDISGQAGRLMDEIEAQALADARTSPDPQAATAYLAGEAQMMRAITHIVIKDMVERVR